MDTPLLHAGLMGTLHAILDAPVAAKAAEEAQQDGLPGGSGEAIASPPLLSPSSGGSAGAAVSATAQGGGGTATSPASSSPASPGASRGGGNEPPRGVSGVGGGGGGGGGERGGVGGGIGVVMNVKKVVTISQNNMKSRDHLMRSSPDVLDRILTVSAGARVGEKKKIE